MWKDFFYYSKSERRSILVLTGMGILLLISGTWVHSSYQPEMPVVDSISIDSFCIRDYKRRASYDSIRWRKKPKTRPVPMLADFDPNVADSATFCRMGLPSFMAKRIINYRQKGGIFHKPEDFARIYGLSQQQFQELKPYIVINRQNLSERLKPRTNMVAQSASLDLVPNDTNRIPFENTRLKYPKGTVLDLNSVDTTQLKRVPGIGSGLARMIISYRNRLGGYADVCQIQEIAPIDTSVNKWFKVDSCVYRPLRVNYSNLDQLRNHPYMNFYKARVILEFRRKRGKIKGLSQLSMFQEFSEKDLQRLKPYLSFE